MRPAPAQILRFEGAAGSRIIAEHCVVAPRRRHDWPREVRAKGELRLGAAAGLLRLPGRFGTAGSLPHLRPLLLLELTTKPH